MEVCAVAFPPEYNELAEKIIDISNEKRQSVSKTIRDMLCDVTGFTPVLTRESRKQKKARKA
jgi:hypothetical protein